MDGRYGN